MTTANKKIFEKLFWKFYLILLKLYRKIQNFLTIMCLNSGGENDNGQFFFLKFF